MAEGGDCPGDCLYGMGTRLRYGGESSLMSKTKEVHKELHIWDREVLKGPVNKLKKLKRELEKRRRGPFVG